MSSNPLVHYYSPCTGNSSTNSAVLVFKKSSLLSAITSFSMVSFIVPQEGLTLPWTPEIVLADKHNTNTPISPKISISRVSQGQYTHWSPIAPRTAQLRDVPIPKTRNSPSTHVNDSDRLTIDSRFPTISMMRSCFSTDEVHKLQLFIPSLPAQPLKHHCSWSRRQRHCRDIMNCSNFIKQAPPKLVSQSETLQRYQTMTQHELSHSAFASCSLRRDRRQQRHAVSL